MAQIFLSQPLRFFFILNSLNGAFPVEMDNDLIQAHFWLVLKKGGNLWPRHFLNRSEGGIFWPVWIKFKNLAYFWENFSKFRWPKEGWPNSTRHEEPKTGKFLAQIHLKFPWLRGHRDLTKNHDLRLWVQFLAKRSIYQLQIAKKLARCLSQGNSNLQWPL